MSIEQEESIHPIGEYGLKNRYWLLITGCWLLVAGSWFQGSSFGL
jgi:hypothetical protein